MKVECEITPTELDGDDGRQIDSVRARCTHCDHETEAYGTSDRSIRRCLVQMREECPRGENNFYVAETLN